MVPVIGCCYDYDGVAILLYRNLTLMTHTDSITGRGTCQKHSYRVLADSSNAANPASPCMIRISTLAMTSVSVCTTPCE